MCSVLELITAWKGWINMRVLAISPHPGYVELMCGGTLAKFSEENNEVFIGHATFVSKDFPRFKDNEKLRKQAAQAASIIGAECLYGELAELNSFDDRSFRDAVMDVIRAARPDVILAPALTSNHVDQRTFSELVFNAAYGSTIPNYISPAGIEPSQTRAPIFYMDTINGVNFSPEVYVDTSQVWEKKVKMIQAYSELDWISEYTGTELLQMCETLSRVRGIQVQVEHSECFQMEKAWGRLRAERVLP